MGNVAKMVKLPTFRHILYVFCNISITLENLPRKHQTLKNHNPKLFTKIRNSRPTSNKKQQQSHTNHHFSGMHQYCPNGQNCPDHYNYQTCYNCQTHHNLHCLLFTVWYSLCFPTKGRL